MCVTGRQDREGGLCEVLEIITEVFSIDLSAGPCKVTCRFNMKPGAIGFINVNFFSGLLSVAMMKQK